MIADKINTFLSSNEGIKNDHLKYEVSKLTEWSFQRQFMDEQEDKPFTLRISSAGKCPRQLAYGYWGFEKKGKEIDSRSKIVFFQGDMVELMVMSLARISGCNIMATGFNQLGITLPINIPTEKEPLHFEISGHPDGILLDGETYLVECKSMASFSFERFEKGEIDDTYLAQINLYLKCLNLKKCIVIAVNKDSGVLNERIFDYDQKIADNAIKNLTEVLTSTKDKLPEPRYTSDEKGFYPWQCRYCSYFGHCRPKAELVLVKGSYKLKEKEDVK